MRSEITPGIDDCIFEETQDALLMNRTNPVFQIL